MKSVYINNYNYICIIGNSVRVGGISFKNLLLSFNFTEEDTVFW